MLGTGDSKLGNIQLGALGAAAPDFDPHITQTLSLSQVVVVNKSFSVSASNTLTLSQVGRYFAPLTPVVGYPGGQTRYVHVRDITLGQDLYTLNPDFPFTYPASTTKVMTAYLIMQYKSGVLDSGSVTFTTADVTLPGGISSGGFIAGDTCTWRELLYAIFVASAGDACQCAARIIGHEIFIAAGSTGNDGMDRFVDTMNSTAISLSMPNTFYDNPWGYSQNGGTTHNIMSARDLSTIAALCLVIPDISVICQTATKSVTTGGGSPHTLSWSNVNYFVNGPTKNASGIADVSGRGGKVGEWTINGSHLNLVQLWQAPNGNMIVITTHNSETYYAMTLDQQGIIHSILRDWPYLDVLIAAGDPFYNNVKILIGGDGSIVDESNSAHSLTVTSVTTGPPVNNTQGGLIYATTASGITIADAPELEPGSSDATIETWYAGPGTITGSPSEFLFLTKLGTSSQREFAINYLFSGRTFSIFGSTDGTNWNSATALSLTVEEEGVFFNGAPRHFALVKSGSTWAAYVSGERMVNTISASPIANTAAPVTLGLPTVSGTGSYDDFRYSIGVARYTPNKVTLDARKFPRTSSADQGTSNTLNLSQVAARNVTYNRTVEQSLTLIGLAFKVSDNTASSTLTLTDTATFVKSHVVIASNTLALTQSATRSVTYGRTVNQGVPLAHAATRKMSYFRSLVQPLTLSQTDSQTNSKKAANTLVLTDAATFQYSHGARHELTLTQSVARSITKIESLHDFLGVFQTLAIFGTHHVAGSNTLALTDVATVQVTKSVKQTLSLTDQAIGELVTPAFDTVVLFDIARVSHTSNVAGNDLLIMNQDLSVLHARAVSASNALGMIQFVRGTKVLHASASDTLTLTQELVQRHFLENVPQTLTLTDVAVANRIIKVSIEQDLNLVQALALSKTIVRSVSDTIVFQNSFQKYIGIANTPYVSVPVVQGVLIKKKCILTLEGPGLSIVLPCPQFNDSESGAGTLTVKRAMDGTRRIYRRDSPTSKLKYDFVMDRLKAIELRNFIMSQNSNVLKLTNHKGEIWYVLMTNSPFTFTEAAFWDSSWGNKSTVTLELEGTRVN